MYEHFYQLSENPFNITADPGYFFLSTQHSEALAHLGYGIRYRKGIIILTGEIGTGKTTLCRSLLNRLDENTRTALILNPNFSELQLLQLILKDLGLETKCKNKFTLVNTLNDFLLKENGQGHNVVVILDEAQNLSVKQLEHIRLLSNLETEKAKLLQIVLVGQPELEEKLRLPQLRQLNQRISVRYHLKPLNRPELNEYIYHRLGTALSQSHPQDKINFTPRALDIIYEHTLGTPRMINIVCDRALLAGFNSETFTINEDVIKNCIEEVLRI